MTLTLAPQTPPSFTCSPGSQRDRGLLALLSHPRDPVGRTVVKDPKTSRYSGFTHPKILGKAGIMGGSQDPKAPTPRGPGSTEAPSPADLGWSFAQIWGGYNPRPPHFKWILAPGEQGCDTHGRSWGAGSSRLTVLARKTLRRRKTTAELQARCCRPHSTLPAPVPQFPHPESAGASGDCAAGATPRCVLGGGREGGKTTHPQPWGTGEAFLTGFSRLTLERGERRW